MPWPWSVTPSESVPFRETVEESSSDNRRPGTHRCYSYKKLRFARLDQLSVPL